MKFSRPNISDSLSQRPHRRCEVCAYHLFQQRVVFLKAGFCAKYGVGPSLGFCADDHSREARQRTQSVQVLRGCLNDDFDTHFDT